MFRLAAVHRADVNFCCRWSQVDGNPGDQMIRIITGAALAIRCSKTKSDQIYFCCRTTKIDSNSIDGFCQARHTQTFWLLHAFVKSDVILLTELFSKLQRREKRM